MNSEKQIDGYINGLEEKNQIYVEEELKYADKCHKLEEQLGCPLEVREKALKKEFIYYDDCGVLRKVVAMNSGYRGNYCVLNCLYNETMWLTIPACQYQKTWWLKKDKSE